MADTDLAKQLKTYIEKSEMSTYRLSLESGVGTSVIARFLNNDSDIQLSNAGKIANVLGLELAAKKEKEPKRNK